MAKIVSLCWGLDPFPKYPGEIIWAALDCWSNPGCASQTLRRLTASCSRPRPGPQELCPRVHRKRGRQPLSDSGLDQRQPLSDSGGSASSPFPKTPPCGTLPHGCPETHSGLRCHLSFQQRPPLRALSKITSPLSLCPFSCFDFLSGISFQSSRIALRKGMKFCVLLSWFSSSPHSCSLFLLFVGSLIHTSDVCAQRIIRIYNIL